MQELLASGAHVDPVNDAGETPLLFALKYNHSGVVKLLIDAGASRGIAAFRSE